MHTWITIAPAGADLPGVQYLHEHEDPQALLTHVAELLAKFGAATRGDELTTERVNQQVELIGADWLGYESDPGDEEDYAATGLKLMLFPAAPDGRNLDVDPVEPRGE